MENMPVEVVGNILSHMSAARDVVLASATCRKWRKAFRKHLRVLSFNSCDWHRYHDLTTSQVEMLITRTIFQTSGLQSLSIIVEDLGDFSASVVMSWLLYTRDSLQELHYDVHTEPDLNVVEICATQKLEKLALVHDVIEQVESKYHRFTSLRSLLLSYTHISELGLNLFLVTCPKLESLELIGLEFSDALVKIEVKAPNLRRFYIEETCMDELILESDSIEDLHLRDTDIEFFKVIGKGSLKKITINHVTIPHLEMCDAGENLETVDIHGFMIQQSEFYRLISKSLKLRMLRLWDVAFGELTEAVDLETITVCCPLLSHLSLDCDLRDEVLLPMYRLQRSTCFGNVVYLKVGWSNNIKDEFVDLVEGLLERCPKLKKLVVDGIISGLKDHEDCQVLARFTTAIVRIMRKYKDVEVQCEFDN